ncbi:MAG: hypothetical protein P1P90_01920 [Patescibacteria group bacterium]|nr:hypothetical protein [Patescibacteria group bacterium]
MNRSTQMFVSCILVLFGIFAIGCGGEGDTYNTYVESNEKCIPGQSFGCVCPGGITGYQVCNDFETYDTCRCQKPEPDAGTTPEASPEGDAEVDAQAEADTDAQVTPDADADAEVEAGEDSGTDAGNDANTDPILTIQGDIPENQTVAAGTVGQIFHSATFCTSQNIEVQELDYKLLGQMGGDVVANDGTPYFTNIKLIDLDFGNTLMGPMELDSNGLTGAQNIHFTDSLIMNAGECKHIAFVASIEDQEVTPGDLYGHEYQVYLNFPLEPYGLVTLADGTELKHDEISLTNHVGGEITIVAPDCPPYHAQSSLTVTEDGHPSSTIVIGGKDVWVPMARYQACAQGNEDVKLSQIGVQWRTQNGGMSAESFSLVGVAHEGSILGTAQFNNNDPYGLVDVDLSNGITIAKGDCQSIELWAKFAPVVSSTQAGGEWSHYARSGKSVSLRIGESVPFYGTDAYCNTADYAGKLFVHARGLTTGEKIFADEGAAQPSFMTVRKSKPIVTPQQLTSTVLSSGEQEIARWQVGADSNGAIAMKQTTFIVTKSANVSLSHFRLYRGSVQLPANEYWITDSVSGADLSAGTINDAATIAVSFVGEDVVSNNGNLYSLRATVGYIGSGNNVSVQFKADFPAVANPITGYLLNNDSYAPYAASPHLFNVGDYSGCNSSGPCGHSLGTFVWSDESNIPHIATTQELGGSRDWAVDQHVEVLSGHWNKSN